MADLRQTKIVMLCLAASAVSALAQLGGGFGRGPQFDQAAVGRGKALFGSNCGFCHGQDARGIGAGPDLARSLLILSDENGKQLADLLQTGIPDRNMPAFPGFSSEQISDIATFLHSQVNAARSRGVPATNVLVGDPVAGETYFKGAGKCSTCHSTAGNLKGIGSKYDPVALQDKIVSPRSGGRGRGDTSDPFPRIVKITLASGQSITGSLILLNEFAVTLRDANGDRRSFRRDGDVAKVEVTDPLQAHQAMLAKYSDTDIHNLTAYLVTLK
jgi:cytochrome c oxidase cbb3-type subunit III